MRSVILAVMLILATSAPVSGQQKEPADVSMRVGFVTLAALTASDIDLSSRAMEHGLIEANPVYSWASDKPGMIGLVNGAMSGAVGVAVYGLHKSGRKKTARWVLWGLNVAKVAVVAWNYRQIDRKLKGR